MLETSRLSIKHEENFFEIYIEEGIVSYRRHHPLECPLVKLKDMQFFLCHAAQLPATLDYNRRKSLDSIWAWQNLGFRLCFSVLPSYRQTRTTISGSWLAIHKQWTELNVVISMGHNVKNSKKKNAGSEKKKEEGGIHVDPTRVRFQHSRIRPYFSGCGRSVEDTLESIRRKEMLPSDLPPIQVSWEFGYRLYLDENVNLISCALSSGYCWSRYWGRSMVFFT